MHLSWSQSGSFSHCELFRFSTTFSVLFANTGVRIHPACMKKWSNVVLSTMESKVLNKCRRCEKVRFFAHYEEKVECMSRGEGGSLLNELFFERIFGSGKNMTIVRSKICSLGSHEKDPLFALATQTTISLFHRWIDIKNDWERKILFVFQKVIVKVVSHSWKRGESWFCTIIQIFLSPVKVKKICFEKNFVNQKLR